MTKELQHTFKCPFTSGIKRCGWQSRHPRNTTHIHDRPALPLPHVRQDGPNSLQRRPIVRLVLLPRNVFRNFFGRPKDRVPSVVDENVDGAQEGFCLGNGLVDGFLGSSDVEGEPFTIWLRGDGRDGVGGLGRIARRGDHVVAGVEGDESNFVAETAGAACDQPSGSGRRHYDFECKMFLFQE